MPIFGAGRICVAMLLVLAVAATGGAAPVRAQDVPDVTHPVAQRAMLDLETHQGECWPWVRKVVIESTGHEMGFGYRDGFFEGGAVEVSLHEAVQGDVIQIADDEDAGPGVDYPGLHTAIVLANNGGGTFTVIDSNSQWDGIVRLRFDYDPLAAAARYAYLDVHAYRFPLTPDTYPGAEPPDPEPPAFAEGDTVRIAAGGDCLNLRLGPSLGDAIIRCIADGTVLDVEGTPAWSGGRYWLPVSHEGTTAWVAAEFVAPSVPEDPEDAGGAAVDDPPPSFRIVVALVAVS